MKQFILVTVTVALYLFLIQLSCAAVLPEARNWFGPENTFALRAALGAGLLALGVAGIVRRTGLIRLTSLFWLFLGNALFLACAMWGEWL